MATADAAESLPAAANRSVLLNRFDHVMTAGWLITAFRAQQGADRMLIESYERDHKSAR